MGTKLILLDSLLQEGITKMRGVGCFLGLLLLLGTGEGAKISFRMKRETSDVIGIQLFDVPSGSDYVLGGGKVDKTMELKTGSGKKKIALKKKKPLFNKDFEIEECEAGKCVEGKMSSKLKKTVMETNWEGKIADDPEATVTVSKLGGGLNLAILSDRKDFDSATYRMSPNGTVHNQESKGPIDMEEEHDSDSLKKIQEKTATDIMYGEAFIDENGQTVRVVEETQKGSSGEDYAMKRIKCCRITKRVCVKARDEKTAKCTVKKGKNVCGDENCKKLHSNIKYNAKQNIKNVLSKNLKSNLDEMNKLLDLKTEDIKGSVEKIKEKVMESIEKQTNQANEEVFKEKDNSLEASKEETEELLLSESEETEEEEDETVEEDVETEADAVKSKLIGEMVYKELNKIHEQTMAHKKSERRTPLSRSFIRCIGACKGGKVDNPKKRIYDERTIELGIFVDKYLWQQMKAKVKGSDEEVKDKMLQMIHSLMSLTESFLSHHSISAHGGFKLAINGVGIWKVKSIHFNIFIQESA